MNTAARMESNGRKSCIHVSEETANELIAAGKSSWIQLREDKIIAKGKGELTTYWLSTEKSKDAQSMGGSSDDSHCYEPEALDAAKQEGKEVDEEGVSAKTRRLIDWNVEILIRLLREIEAQRSATTRKNSIRRSANETVLHPAEGQTVLDEVSEIITLPKFDARLMSQDPDDVVLDKSVFDQLHDYVKKVASGYRDNPCKFVSRPSTKPSTPNPSDLSSLCISVSSQL